MLLAALNVRYRDVKYVVPFAVQLWLFVTPIIYPTSFVPQRYRSLVALNPMTGIVEGLRASISADPSFDWGLIAASCGISVALFTLGAMYFRRAEREFADVV